jgi:hypothetical protein
MKKLVIAFCLLSASVYTHAQQVERAPYTVQEANQKIEMLESRKSGLETRKSQILSGNPTAEMVEKINKQIEETNAEIQRWVGIKTSIIAAEGKKKGVDQSGSK